MNVKNAKLKLDNITIERDKWSNVINAMRVEYTLILNRGEEAKGTAVIRQDDPELERKETPIMELQLIEILHVLGERLTGEY